MPQIFGGKFGAGKKRGWRRIIGVEADGSRGAYSAARRTEEGRDTHEVVCEDFIVAH